MLYIVTCLKILFCNNMYYIYIHHTLTFDDFNLIYIYVNVKIQIIHSYICLYIHKFNFLTYYIGHSKV